MTRTRRNGTANEYLALEYPMLFKAGVVVPVQSVELKLIMAALHIPSDR